MQTLGFSSKQIIMIFIIQGSIITIIGTIIGMLVGIFLSLNVATIIDLIQTVFNIQILNSSIYQIKSIPSKLAITDIAYITTSSIILSFLAILYPSWRASRIIPAEILRHG